MLGLSVIILFKSVLHVFCSLVFSAHNSSELDMVADMEVDKVADKLADIVADMVADMEVDM